MNIIKSLTSYKKEKNQEVDIFLKFVQEYGYIAIFFMSLVIGIITARNGKFIDEGDNLVVGMLLNKGQILYRDIFSHHFPFPYYWTAFVIWVFGFSLVRIRIAYWVFEILLLGLTLKYSRYRLEISIFSLLWSIIRVYYSANLILYHSFSGVFLISIFILVLSVEPNRNYPRGLSIFLGFLMTACVLTDPFTIYPIVVAFVALLIKNHKIALSIIPYTVVFSGVYLIYLLCTGTLSDIVQNAILFNTKIYSRYRPVQISKLSEVLHNIKTIFNLVNIHDWDFSLLPVKNKFDSWVFGGFIIRLAFVLGILLFGWQKKIGDAALILGFGAVLVGTDTEEMRVISLTMISLFILIMFIFHNSSATMIGRMVLVGRVVVCIGFILSSAWLVENVVKNNSDSSEAIYYLEKKGENIRSIACNLDRVLLVDYPNGTYTYWFSGYQPATKYIFFWPWVADVGQEEVIAKLDANKNSPVLVHISDTKVWNRYPTSEYLSSLLDYLGENYSMVKEEWYFSPGLSAQCEYQPD